MKIFLILICILYCISLYTRSKELFYLNLTLVSLLIVYLYTYLHAYDVAITEASVSVSINSLLLFYILKKEKNFEYEFKVLYIIVISLLLSYCIYLYLPKDLSYIKSKIYVEYANINCMVSEILASFRGFDTLCETLVIFLASIAIIKINNIKIYLNFHMNKAMQDIIRVILFISFAIAFYIHLNGNLAPGGGFQSAAILFFILFFLSYQSIKNNKYINYIGMSLYLIVAFSGELIQKNMMYFSNLKLGIEFVELSILMAVLFSFAYMVQTKYDIVSNIGLLRLNDIVSYFLFLPLLLIIYFYIYIFILLYLIYLSIYNRVLNIFNFLILFALLFDFYLPIIEGQISYYIVILFFVSLPIYFYLYFIWIIKELFISIITLYRICFSSQYKVVEKEVLLKYQSYWTSIAIYSITFTPGTISYYYDDKYLKISCISQDHADSIMTFLTFFKNCNEDNILRYCLKKFLFYSRMLQYYK